MTYNTSEIFVRPVVLNNAVISGSANDVIKEGQLLTADGEAFKAWGGDFSTPIDAAARGGGIIPASGEMRLPVAIGEMSLDGIAAANNVTDLDELRVAAFKGGLVLN